MSQDFNRRAVTTGLGMLAAGPALAQPIGNSGRPYRVGVIGSGWFGKLNVNALMAIAPVEVVALCDVDSAMLAEAREKTFTRTDTVLRQRRRPATYSDYREMLRRHRFDIVIVATPDHWHALPAIAAMDAGAHVYLEKPVSVDVVEGQALVAAARRNDRVVAAGTQRRACPPHAEAKARVVDAGLLGKVGYAEIFSYHHQRLGQTSAPSTPPATLNWDFYCGPAPLIPYRAEIHPLNWRSFHEFGNGYMGDMGVHMLDLTRYQLGLSWPKRVRSLASINFNTNAADAPDTQIATFEYDALNVTWTNRHWGASALGEPWGANIYGDRGTLRLGANGYEFTPISGEKISGELQPEFDRFPQDHEYRDWEWALASMTRANMRDFVGAIETGGRPLADIEECHISTSSCILANISASLDGRVLNWDGANQRVTGDDEANGLLARPYRAPWVHPEA